MIALDAKTSALVMIDLQNFIIARPTAPHSSAEVVARAQNLAKEFRAAGAVVIWVRVGFSSDWRDMPPQNVDEPTKFAAPLPPGAFELTEGLAAPGDLHVVKRQWGAFHGTDLDLQLRRRGIKTIVLGGVATNFGVESTARSAWEHGYDVVVAEDACASTDAELHAFAVSRILPRLARIASSADVSFSG
jgi:nicotinamidase-related amidase